MFESYDVMVRNPYGAKLSTQQLNPGGAFKAVSIAIPAGQELAEHTAPSPKRSRLRRERWCTFPQASSIASKRRGTATSSSCDKEPALASRLPQ